ncbi:MAG: transporter substrate-binding domain-containing protein [Lentisphaerales bacterium]|nr:transporter substrate-binding domain-containing protein [Lentisphaerales bacterium]
MAFWKAFFILFIIWSVPCFGQLKLTEKEKAWLAEHPVIKVANEDDWPPFDYSEKGKALGLTISYTDLLAEKIGVNFEYVNGLKWEKLLEFGKSQKIDLMPCIWYEKEREQFFNYTESYISNPVVIVTNKKNKTTKRIEDLKGRKVAFIDAYVIKNKILKAFPEIQPVLVKSPLEALLLVNLGNVEAYVDSLGMVSYQIEKNILSGLQNAGRHEMPGVENENNLYMAVRKDWPIFHGILQKALKAITEEEKRLIHERWLMNIHNATSGKYELLSVEKQWLESIGTLRLGIQANQAPISYFGRGHGARGITLDYVKGFEYKVGDVFSFEKLSGNARTALQEKNVDVVGLMYDENDSEIIYSQPYLSLPLVIVSGQGSPIVTNFFFLEDKKVGIVQNTLIQKILEDKLTSVEVLQFENTSAALQALEAGEVKAFVGDFATVSYSVQKYCGYEFMVANTTGVNVDYCFAVRKDMPQLVSIIDRYLSSIAEEKKQVIEHRWLNLRMEDNFSLSDYWREFTLIGVIILVILGAIVLWNRRLSREITERLKVEASLVKAREMAEASDRAKSEFLAVMSHEIRTPLNGIIGMSQILEDSSLTKEQKTQCGIIVESGKSLLTIINDILDFSKIESGKMHFEVLPFNLRESVSFVIKLYEQLAQEKGLELVPEINVGDTDLNYLGDEGRLRQVLLNLVNNAIKFTKEGTVTVKVELTAKSEEQDAISIIVEDTGIGIPPENQSKLFKKFSQADSSTTRKYGGTGLGLAICKNIVELMGGEISCISKPDKGSQFVVDLKFERVNSQVQKKKTTSLNKSLVELDVLLVEDNIVNQKIAMRILEKLGCHVRVAENGIIALQRLSEQQPDIILMDCHMPVMDGYETTRKIRNDKQYGDMPIIALTANALESDKQKCLDCGMNDFLTKPFNKDVFQKVVQSYSVKNAV